MIQFFIWLLGIFESTKSLIWFFLIKKSKIILFEVSPAELFAHLEVDPVQSVSDAINIASTYDLNLIDRLAATDSFWNNEDWPEEYEELKYVLKLGWLITDIKQNGLKNPIQLLQSSNQKYIVHPGTARILVLSYLLPLEKIKVVYVWDNALDQNPFFSNNPYTIIDNTWSFLKLFNKSINFRIKAANLNDSTKCIDGHKYFYFKLAVDSLKNTHTRFNLNFITFIDHNHWISNIKHRVYFKDIINFEKDQCMLSGIKFTKIKDKWIMK